MNGCMKLLKLQIENHPCYTQKIEDLHFHFWYKPKHCFRAVRCLQNVSIGKERAAISTDIHSPTYNHHFRISLSEWQQSGTQCWKNRSSTWPSINIYIYRWSKMTWQTPLLCVTIRSMSLCNKLLWLLFSSSMLAPSFHKASIVWNILFERFSECN